MAAKSGWIRNAEQDLRLYCQYTSWTRAAVAA